GARLRFSEAPRISLFPSRSLELGASSWSSPDGSVRLSFSHAFASISSHALLTGRLVIKKLEVSDLSVAVSHSPYEGRIRDALLDHSMLNRLSSRSQLFRDILDLAPNAVDITGGWGTLILDDGTAYSVHPLEFSASNIHADSNTSFSLRAGISRFEPHASASLSMGGALSIRDDTVSLQLDTSVFTPEEGMGFSEPITLSGGLSYDLSGGSLALGGLRFSGFGQQAALSGDVRSLSNLLKDPHHADARVRIESRLAPPALAVFFPAYRSLLVAMGGECTLSADCLLDSDAVRLNNISASLGGADIRGELVQPLRQAALEGRLETSTLDMEGFSRLLRTVAASPLLANESFWPRLAVTLSTGKFSAGKLEATGVSCRLSGKEGHYELNPLSFSLAGTQAAASLRFSLLPTAPLSARGEFGMSVSDADLERIAAFYPPASVLRGRVNANLELNWTSSRSLSTLSGRGSLTSSDLLLSLPGYGSGADPGQGTLFSTFSIGGGVLSCSDFTLSAGGADIAAKGQLSILDKTVDASGEVRSASQTLPFTLRGSALAPSFHLLPAQGERLGFRFPQPGAKE
ncbi:MAG: hypothetical protein IKS68_00695, partial [Mailhella sp.]|nr:hypothetical protein [Mailhella sp.]